MTLKIDFFQPVFPKKIAREITVSDLDNFYATSSDLDKSNLFFMLLASSYHYENSGDFVIAAHLYFLTAYYIFVPLTPPGSYQLAMHYISKAAALNPTSEYKEWLSLMEKGN